MPNKVCQKSQYFYVYAIVILWFSFAVVTDCIELSVVAPVPSDRASSIVY